MNPEHVRYFAKFIEDELGIIYDDSNHFQLVGRLQDMMKLYAFKSLDEMYQKALGGIFGGFRQMLLDVATNNETFFFRDTKVFQSLSGSVIPDLASQVKPHETLRIWSAACSAGQEPYSMAILLAELREEMNLPKVEILATDISKRVLDRAQTGIYSQLEVQRGLPIPLLIKYFTKTNDDRWELKPEIRSNVTFKEKNLKDSFNDMGTFHLVLCRNVLIYHKMEGKIDIIDRISKRLNPNGCLILGSAESLFGVSNAFNQLIKDGVVFHLPKVAA